MSSSTPGSSIFTRVFLAVMCGLFIFVCAAPHVPALYRIWNVALIGRAVPHFTDSAAVLGGADSIRANGGRFSWEFIVAHAYMFNYPRVWAYLGWLLGLGSAHIFGVGVAFAALQLLCQFLLLRPGNAPTLAVALLIQFSPSCLLVLERGNNDSVILALVVAATAWLASADSARRSAGSVLLTVAACLKFYPIAALAAVMRRWGWRAAAGVAVPAVLFAAYALAVHDDLTYVSKMTPRPDYEAYGGQVATSFAKRKLETSPAPPARRDAIVGTVRTVSFAAVLLLGGGALLAGVRSAGRGPEETLSTELARTRFRVGAAIYGGTFLIGNNWDYRLAFLSLTVPLLGGWLRLGDPLLRRRAAVVLGLIVVSLYAYNTPRTALAFGLTQLVTWTLFVILTFLFGLMLPPELREPLRRILRAPPSAIVAA